MTFLRKFPKCAIAKYPNRHSRANQWTRFSCLSDVFPFNTCWQSLNQFWERSSFHSKNYLTDNASNLEDANFVSASFQLLLKEVNISKFSFQVICKERYWICINILSPKICSCSFHLTQFYRFSKQNCSFSVQVHLWLLISNSQGIFICD